MRPKARIGRLLAAILLCALSAGASARTYLEPDERALLHIKLALGAGDCKAAVDNLKPGLKAKQPDVLLMAGLMYEEGYCLAPNWDKAAGLYMRADEAGNRSAIPRLIAGYAKPGRDNAMALAWAARAPHGTYAKACIPDANPDTDPERFNDELERMPARHFQGCVYLVGVVADVMAESSYPPLALVNHVSGKFFMEFNPARGTITWRVEELEQGQAFGVRDLQKAELDDPRTIRNSLMNYLKQKGERALSRYLRPESDFPPDWTVAASFIFTSNLR